MCVAGAVYALVVMPHHGREFLVLQVRDHLGAVAWVTLDDGKFLVVETPVPVRMERGVSLPNVVQRRCQPDLVTGILG